MLHMWTRAISGSVMTRVAMIRTITWTIRGSMAALPADLGLHTDGVLPVADRAASGSTAGTGALRPMIWTIAAAGIGLATTSSSTRIQTIPDGISPTTRASEHTFMSSILVRCEGRYERDARAGLIACLLLFLRNNSRVARIYMQALKTIRLAVCQELVARMYGAPRLRDRFTNLHADPKRNR